MTRRSVVRVSASRRGASFQIDHASGVATSRARGMPTGSAIHASRMTSTPRRQRVTLAPASAARRCARMSANSQAATRSLLAAEPWPSRRRTPRNDEDLVGHLRVTGVHLDEHLLQYLAQRYLVDLRRADLRVGRRDQVLFAETLLGDERLHAVRLPHVFEEATQRHRIAAAFERDRLGESALEILNALLQRLAGFFLAPADRSLSLRLGGPA